MISHQDALASYESYFADRLSRSEMRDFHAHINDCEDCKTRLRTMRATAPRAGFTLGRDSDADLKLQGVLKKNRVMMYAILAVLICFFFLYKLKRG